MASNLPSFEAFSSNKGRPINIVPLYVPGQVKPAAPPAQLVYNNGPLLTAAQVFTVFWGAAWEQSPLDATIQSINDFFDYILTSPLIDQLAEYSVQGQTIGHGSRVGTTTLTTPDPGTSVDDSAIQQMLNNGIASNSAFPQPNANTLYFVYLPGGVTVTASGSSSCQSFCGYHDAINSQVYYAVMPYPDCTGCSSSLATFDALTVTSSHELCEAITDPVPGQGWYDQSNGEIGDICAWQTRQVGSYTVQQEWSNSANSCV
ncbi:MAG: hypothetical protein ACRDIV_14130 [Ktedonobacteraceae bacterium]